VKKLISARFRTKAKRSPVGGSGHIIAAQDHSADHIVFGSPRRIPDDRMSFSEFLHQAKFIQQETWQEKLR
jgi:hypothetical protein